MQKRDAIDAAQVIRNIRPDWQQPGILAALMQMPQDLSYAEAVAHAVTVAANPVARTPTAINIMPVKNEPTTTSPLNIGPICDICGNQEHHCQKIQRKWPIADRHDFTRRTA
jgi:hypothetical protein